MESNVARVLETTPPGDEQVEAIASMPDRELISRYRWGIEHFDRRLVRLDDEVLDTAFLPDSGVGRWPIRAVVGHLADAEISNTQRLRRALSEDGPVVAGWDPDAYIDAGLYGPRMPVAGFIAVIYTLRVWIGEVLGTLDDAGWSRPLLHERRGPMTARTLAAFNVWHLERHAWFVNAKIEKLLGAVVDLPPEAGAGGCCAGRGAAVRPAGEEGCGSGCGCVGQG